jgi:uncharacterized membrane protein YuzA (DUF378 family)
MISKVAKVLLAVGGLNWGLVGIGMLLDKMPEWNVVHMVLNSMPAVEGIVYVLVGVAALMSLFGCKCGKCKSACTTCVVPGKMEGGM